MSQQGAGRLKRHATDVVARVETEQPIRVAALVRVAIDVTCRDGCDVGSAAVSVAAPDGTSHTTTVRDGHIEVVAPATAGVHTWVLALSERIDGDVVHAACAQSFAFDVVPHEASLAVWAVPDAAVADAPFAIKVGATSTAGRVLGGQAVVVFDAAGVEAGRAVLGCEKWPGTEALHWAEVALIAPTEPGVSSWSASLETASLDLAHETHVCAFTVPVTAVPAHRITVTVIDAATGAPLDEAIVRVGAFRATTDAKGCATLQVPKGAAQMVVWKAGYDAPDAEIDVERDIAVRITASAVPEDDPDARWRG